jgi:peptide/nickel transport system ATP-binding protein
MTTDAPVMLEAVDVVQSFDVKSGIFSPRRELRAVRGVSFKVRRGDTLAIVGESGCGKSTLARILIGVEKPSSGTVFLEGQDIAGIDRLSFSSRVQPIFQDPYSSLNPRRSIFETVEQPLIVHGMTDKDKRRKRVEDVLDLVGLPKRVLGSFPKQMSGGQRQRVAIARALILNPSIIVCDEPTSALDVSIQAQILNLLQDIQQELGVTYVFISHNLAVVEHIASQVAVMYLGRIVEMGEAKPLLTRPEHPYTKALLASILTPDPDLDIPDVELGSAFPDPLNPPAGCLFYPRCSVSMETCRTLPPRHDITPDREIECHLAAPA